MTIDDALPPGEVSTASRAPRDVPIIRVLAIDGGGLRGIIPLRVLMELERLTGRGAATLFDVVAGTSTGGVVALALCRPDADGKPAMSAARILEIYLEWAPKIFVKPKLRTAVPLLRQKASRAAMRQRVGALVTPRRYGNARYSAEGIENLYKDCMGDARLVDALTDVIVPAYDWKAGRTQEVVRSDFDNAARTPGPEGIVRPPQCTHLTRAESGCRPLVVEGRPHFRVRPWA